MGKHRWFLISDDKLSFYTKKARGGGGGGDSHMKQTGMLVGNFEGDQSGRGLSKF